MSRTRTFTAVAALTLGAGFAGCVSPRTNELTSANNPSLYSVHQPVVERSDFVLDLATQGGRVSRTEIERLHGWFASIGLRYGDRIAVDEGYGAGRARDDIALAVSEYGLSLADGPPVTPGQVPAGSVRVIATRDVASVRSCPDWNPEDNGASPRQNTSTNFGCATNANLATMIANPADLVRGQSDSGNGAAGTASRAIRVYRQRQPTSQQALPAATTRGGGQ
ncbi:CpaD family pilus assembly protein [Sphingosinicella sp.]|uniref:CpaD family pilus assembly protein n=1 Tax=Sphingosinicella sp. TaxID=1917971 RepID=UPI004037AC8C